MNCYYCHYETDSDVALELHILNHKLDKLLADGLLVRIEHEDIDVKGKTHYCSSECSGVEE